MPGFQAADFVLRAADTGLRAAGTTGRLGYDAVRIAHMTGQRQQGQPAQGAPGDAEEEMSAAGKQWKEAGEQRVREGPEAGARILDECARFVAKYVSATPAQIDAMVLLAAQSWATDVLFTTPRGLWVGRHPKSGKTTGMVVTAALSYDAVNTSGTSYALQSKIAAAHGEQRPCPTLYRDDISKVFGNNGTRGTGSPLYPILCEGYKAGSTSSWSVDRTAVDFSTFSTFLMSGLMAAVPEDVRDRCVVFNMERGRAPLYYDVRDAQPLADGKGKALGSWVRRHRDEIGRFRAGAGIHPLLVARRKEVWEGMIAVAACAGQDWLNRAVRAFTAIALEQADVVVLSPDQTILRDLAAIVTPLDADFVGSGVLIQGLTQVQSPLYEGRSEHGIACLIREAVPFDSRQINRVRGYFRDDLIAAWEQVRPPDPADVILPELEDPFEVTDDDETVEGIVIYDGPEPSEDVAPDGPVLTPDADGIYEADIISDAA
jgi:Protein of unknown function (DUF3631)